MFTHTFYINDLDNLCDNQRTSAINVIEHILNKAYRQEMDSFIDVFKRLQMHKKPKVFCMYQDRKREIIIDKISFSFSRDRD